jgi:hypothetical protein
MWLHPHTSLIRSCCDEKSAGKSWPVNMRHEVHGKDSGQGLHFSAFRSKEHPLLIWAGSRLSEGMILVLYALFSNC